MAKCELLPFFPSSMHNKVKVRPYAWFKSVNSLGRWPGEAVLQDASSQNTWLGFQGLQGQNVGNRG